MVSDWRQWREAVLLRLSHGDCLKLYGSRRTAHSGSCRCCPVSACGSWCRIWGLPSISAKIACSHAAMHPTSVEVCVCMCVHPCVRAWLCSACSVCLCSSVIVCVCCVMRMCACVKSPSHYYFSYCDQFTPHPFPIPPAL